MEKTQLFMLHFAGGSRYSFNFLLPLLKEFSIFPLELPGRGMRLNESLLKDFDMAANDIFEQMLAKLNSSKFIIFGHSMGASLMLRIVNLLEKVNMYPSYLIVSGNPGPMVTNKIRKKRYLMNNESFKDELKLLGCSNEIIDNNELFNFFEPILRADFEVIEKNKIKIELPVKVPIFAIMGSEEEFVSQIFSWADCTTASFKYQIMDGDHFFIHNQSIRIASIFKQCNDDINNNHCLTVKIS